jgi:hypothetical protein
LMSELCPFRNLMTNLLTEGSSGSVGPLGNLIN